MSNDGRICFIVVPDKKYYGLLLKKYGSHFKLHVLQKNPTRVRAPHPPRYHHRGNNQA